MGGRKRRETSMNSRRIVFARRVRCALCRLVSVVLILHLAEARAGSELLEHAGLRAPVEIILDPWGVAHIYAQSEADLFFAQGYHVARTRLFQLEIWRRQATGTVAEILGRRELPRDIGARLLRYRGDMDRELNHYHPRGRQIIESFVNGINAFVEQAQDNPELLPSEFRLLGIRPGRWTPEVVVSRHQGLMHNVAQELEYGRAVALLGAAQVKELVWFHPGEARVELDSALNSALNAGVLEADILQLYRAARSSIAFQPEDVLPEFRAAASPPPLRAEAALLVDRSSPPFDWRDIGSNNWVVSGRLTADGSTIMANDPHRVLQAPSLRYFTHLVAPGWNVIGGGEPSLPGVSIGHNEFGAWGLTVFQVDAEDLYVYQTHPRDPLQYRYGDGWEPMQVLRESIPVKGEAAVEVDLKFTRHGPVLYEDAKRQVACALRAGWLEPGGAPYLASLRMDVARNWDEFCDACAYSHIPGENMVWADREGNIGWQAVGIAPLRSNWDGLVPVPGDGRYEWQGYLPGKQLPQVVNPPKGFWNTSNENLVPENYPHRRALGWTWVDPFRGARVHEVLAAGRKFNMMDMMQLQQDELSIPARMLVPLLRDLPPPNDEVGEAMRRLQDWDFVLDRDSVPAGIYAMWERRLKANLHGRLVPQAAQPHIKSLSMKRILDWLLAPDGRLGDDPLAGRDALLLMSLEEALTELQRRFGADMQSWRYGQAGYKHVYLQHPLSPAVSQEWRARLNVGPLPRGGNSYTVNNTGDSDNQPSGGSFRVIIDTQHWDASLASNSPGQGGGPDSPHYRDLFALWAQGRYFPLLYSRAKIEAVSGAGEGRVKREE
jgi:penicillin G amidase